MEKPKEPEETPSTALILKELMETAWSKVN